MRARAIDLAGKPNRLLRALGRPAEALKCPRATWLLGLLHRRPASPGTYLEHGVAVDGGAGGATIPAVQRREQHRLLLGREAERRPGEDGEHTAGTRTGTDQDVAKTGDL